MFPLRPSSSRYRGPGAPSTVPLAPGLAGDFYVVLRKVTDSTQTAGILSGILLLLAGGFWFGDTGLVRARDAARGG